VGERRGSLYLTQGVDDVGGAFIIVSALVGALLLCGWVVWRLIGMCLLREISGLELIILVGVILGLVIGAVGARGPAAIPFLILLWAGGMMYPVLLALAERRKARKMERDDITGYLRALDKQPDVPYPHRKLGDIYKERGDWDRAIEHYQSYLEVHEDAADMKFRLKKCLTARRREAMGLRVCPACGAESPGDAVRCGQCGFYLKGTQEIIDTLTTPEMMRIWRWLIVIFIVPGVVVNIFQGFGPAVGAVLLFLALCAAALFLYGKLIRPEEETS